MAWLELVRRAGLANNEAIATGRNPTMDTTEFDELAGRIDGLAKAVLILAQMVEQETCMDGLTLTARWREAVPKQAGAGSLDTAHKTLQELARRLDDVRTRRQEAVRKANLSRG